MHRVAFFVYPSFELLDMAGPASVFDGANYVLSQSRKPRFYTIDLVSTNGGPVTSSSGVAVHSLRPRDLARRAVDTLLVAGAQREHLIPVLADAGLRTWLPKFVSKVPRFGSVCSGAFILAALGMLDGRHAATHWRACDELAKAFPTVTVDPDALYVVDERIWTSAGVTTGIDMALAMVARDLDSAIAGQVAKGLVLYARRPGHQSQFSPLLRAQLSDDDPFARLIAWMQVNLDENLDVPSLAAQVGLTERTFYRRFIAAVGESPARFVESVRLEAARTLLSHGQQLKAVAAEVGLPPARLRVAFERRFGLAPRLFREIHAET
jgi:transcriptional regulator GlxA family with amidase domain